MYKVVYMVECDTCGCILKFHNRRAYSPNRLDIESWAVSKGWQQNRASFLCPACVESKKTNNKK